MSVNGPLKWHGGKHYLAARIVALMPPHVHYVEPYFGGGAVLLHKDPEGVSEVVNDIDENLSNFWNVLQRPATFAEFQRRCEATPFSELEWDIVHLEFKNNFRDCDPVSWAHRFFVHCRQSLAGRRKGFAPLSRTRTRRGMNEQVSAWLACIEGLPAVHARLKRVVILSHDALEVIRQQDGPETLFYLDPPYLDQTRTAPDVYAHEMTAAQHGDLLEACVNAQGHVMLSGYPSEFYDGHLLGSPAAKKWTRHDFDLPNNAAGGGTKRRMTESLWCNFSLASEGTQG